MIFAAIRLILLATLLGSCVACASVESSRVAAPGEDKPDAEEVPADRPVDSTRTRAAAPDPSSGRGASEETAKSSDGGRGGGSAGVGGPSPGVPSGHEDDAHPPADAPRSSGGGASAGKMDGAPEIREAPRVRMVPSATSVTVGNPLFVRVQIEGASDLGSVPFHVVYNAAVLRFEGGQEGPFLRGDGRPTAFFAAPTSGGNELVVGLSRLGSGDGVGGGGELCRLDFTVVGAGEAGLSFTRAHVRDSANRIVPAVFEAAPVIAR